MQFSHTSGTFVDAFILALTVDSTDAVIHYTTNGAIPNETSPIYVGPMLISTTTRVRARAVEVERGLGPTISESFIFLDSTVATFDSNVPLIVLDTFGAGEPTPSDNTILRPVSAVFIDTGVDGRAQMTGEVDWAGRGGIRVRGETSAGFPKKQYAFETWTEDVSDTSTIYSANAPDLAVSILGMPEESDWIIHGPYSDKTLMRNYLSYQWSNEIGLYAVRCQFVEVFLNTNGGKINYASDYVGSFVFMEKIKGDAERVDIEPLMPTQNSEPEITGGYIWKKDKTDQGAVYWYTSRGQFFTHVEPDTLTSPQKAYLEGYVNSFEAALYGPNFRDPDVGYRAYIDVDSWIDNWILVELTKNIDGYRLSTYWSKDRGGKIKMGPIWDYNLSLGNANYLNCWIPQGWYADLLGEGDYPYWRRLFQDPDFQQRLTDRWTELRQDVFTTENLLADVDEATSILNESAERNFEKWQILGIYLWPNPVGYQTRDTFQKEVDWMKDWIVPHVAWMDDQFLAAPQFSHEGGQVEAGLSVELIDPNSPEAVIYYTLDGSDPRLAGGGVAPQALTYLGTPITINESTVVTARAWESLSQHESPWSAPATADFVVGTPAGMGNLV
ncbi:MAG: hypothetical protein A2V70_12790, partial [Planctomycetes bacterium RBG_13_63_9]